MKGSTFTVSNAGALGGHFATPIVNPPEVAILALHPVEQRPVVQNGQLAPGWRMNISLSFDHRVLDGADAIRFTQTLGSYTADPGEVASGVDLRVYQTELPPLLLNKRAGGFQVSMKVDSLSRSLHSTMKSLSKLL